MEEYSGLRDYFNHILMNALENLNLPGTYISKYLDAYNKLDTFSLAWLNQWVQEPYFKQMNEELREEKLSNDIFKYHLYILIRLIDLMPPLPQDIYLYRGIKMNKDIIQRKNDGGFINIDSGLSSLTANPNISKSFVGYYNYGLIKSSGTCCETKILIPKGTRIIAIFANTDQEFLTYPGCIFETNNTEVYNLIDKDENREILFSLKGYKYNMDLLLEKLAPINMDIITDFISQELIPNLKDTYSVQGFEYNS